MANIFNITRNRVQLGEGKFDTVNNYLYQDKSFESTLDNPVFTTTLVADSLRIYQEQSRYLNLSFDPREGTDNKSFGRINYGPSLPISGPFLLYYSVDGSGDLTRFANILLIDKPPTKTGFYNFSINGIVFQGLVRQVTKYSHWDWELISPGSYGYRKKAKDIGYGIEISINQLFDTESYTENGKQYFRVKDKPLKTFLMDLKGNEEILSFPATVSPETYNIPVKGIPTSIPINTQGSDIFYDFTRGYDLFNISREEALYYIASYPDLITSLGPNPTKGINHYNTIGLEQGRKITFNPISYINTYPDIKLAYNYDTVAATIQYITTGYASGRTIVESSSTFSGRGALYDERIGNLYFDNKNIIWPNGQTMNARGKSLNYIFDRSTFTINGNLPKKTKKIYLRIH